MKYITPDGLAALRLLSALAIPLAQIRAEGWRSMIASTDLHAWGYSIREWMLLPTGRILVEYHARFLTSGLPRVTASTYAEQCAIHQAIGVVCVPPGEYFRQGDQPYLFS